MYLILQTIYIFRTEGNEPLLLDHVRSIPEVNIVLMAVYDSAEYCRIACQTSLGLVGGKQQGFRNRGKGEFSPGRGVTVERLIHIKLHNMNLRNVLLNSPMKFNVRKENVCSDTCDNYYTILILSS